MAAFVLKLIIDKSVDGDTKSEMDVVDIVDTGKIDTVIQNDNVATQRRKNDRNLN